MNKTKKLTTGAMLLALIGAFMLIDRQLSYVFTYFIVLLIPVIIAVYCCMYSMKDGYVLCVGVVALSILFGSLYTYMYLPASIITGLCISAAIRKDYDRRRVMLISIAVFVLSELLITFLVSPLLGVSVDTQLKAMEVTFNEMSNVAGVSGAMNAVVGNLGTFLLVVFIFSTMLTGVLEGYLISFMTVFVLKRMKIKNIGYNSAMDIKMPEWLAYVLFFFTASLMFMNVPILMKSEFVKYSLMCLGVFSSLILFYYGYLFMIIYLKKKGGRVNIFLLLLGIFILMPFSYIILLVVGFLYGSGPLRRKLENEKE